MFGQLDTDDSFSELLQGADEEIKENYEKDVQALDENLLLNQIDENEESEGGEEEDDVHVTKV